MMHLCHAGTQFGQCRIGLFLNLGAEEWGIGLQDAVGAMGLGLRSGLARGALLVPPFLDRGQADAKECGNGFLRVFSGFEGREDTVA